MANLYLYCDTGKNAILNADAVTLLRQIYLVQGSTYDVYLAFLDNGTPISTPTMGDFSFTANVGSMVLVSSAVVTASGNAAYPMVFSIVASSSNLTTALTSASFVNATSTISWSNGTDTTTLASFTSNITASETSGDVYATAGNISFTPFESITATNVQAAIQQAETAISTNATNIASNTTAISTNTANIASNTTAISTNNGLAVHLAGAETITGVKTFTAIPVLPKIHADGGAITSNGSGSLNAGLFTVGSGISIGNTSGTAFNVDTYGNVKSNNIVAGLIQANDFWTPDAKINEDGSASFANGDVVIVNGTALSLNKLIALGSDGSASFANGNASIDALGDISCLGSLIGYINQADDGMGNSLTNQIAYFGGNTPNNGWTASINGNDGSAYFSNQTIAIGNAYANNYIDSDGSALFANGNFQISPDGSITNSLGGVSVDIGSQYGELFIGYNSFLSMIGSYPLALNTNPTTSSQIGNVFFNPDPTFTDAIDLNYDGSASFANGCTLLNNGGSVSFANGAFTIDSVGNFAAPYIVATSNVYFPRAGQKYAANTTSGIITVTLPQTPNPGDNLEIIDAVGTWGTHHLTVTPYSGTKLNGSTSSVNYTTSARLLFVYINSTYGWRQQ